MIGTRDPKDRDIEKNDRDIGFPKIINKKTYNSFAKSGPSI